MSEKFEVWVTFVRDGQLAYECREAKATREEAMHEALDQTRFQRTLLAEVKIDGEVIWAVRGGEALWALRSVE